jgi:hypothetical protein
VKKYWIRVGGDAECERQDCGKKGKKLAEATRHFGFAVNAKSQIRTLHQNREGMRHPARAKRLRDGHLPELFGEHPVCPRLHLKQLHPPRTSGIDRESVGATMNKREPSHI